MKFKDGDLVRHKEYPENLLLIYNAGVKTEMNRAIDLDEYRHGFFSDDDLISDGCNVNYMLCKKHSKIIKLTHDRIFGIYQLKFLPMLIVGDTRMQWLNSDSPLPTEEELFLMNLTAEVLTSIF